MAEQGSVPNLTVVLKPEDAPEPAVEQPTVERPKKPAVPIAPKWETVLRPDALD